MRAMRFERRRAHFWGANPREADFPRAVFSRTATAESFIDRFTHAAMPMVFIVAAMEVVISATLPVTPFVPRPLRSTDTPSFDAMLETPAALWRCKPLA